MDMVKRHGQDVCLVEHSRSVRSRTHGHRATSASGSSAQRRVSALRGSSPMKRSVRKKLLPTRREVLGHPIAPMLTRPTSTRLSAWNSMPRGGGPSHGDLLHGPWAPDRPLRDRARPGTGSRQCGLRAPLLGPSRRVPAPPLGAPATGRPPFPQGHLLHGGGCLRTRWKIQSTPTSVRSTTSSLNGISCVGPTACSTAVGEVAFGPFPGSANSELTLAGSHS